MARQRLVRPRAHQRLVPLRDRGDERVHQPRIAAAVAKGNQSLAQGWSKALAETMADGSYTQLSKKYFNEDVRCN